MKVLDRVFILCKYNWRYSRKFYVKICIRFWFLLSVTDCYIELSKLFKKLRLRFRISRKFLQNVLIRSLWEVIEIVIRFLKISPNPSRYRWLFLTRFSIKRFLYLSGFHVHCDITISSVTSKTRRDRDTATNFTALQSEVWSWSIDRTFIESASSRWYFRGTLTEKMGQGSFIQQTPIYFSVSEQTSL